MAMTSVLTTIDPALLDALEEGIILLDDAQRVVAVSGRAMTLLFEPAGVAPRLDEPFEELVKRTIASGSLKVPEGLSQADYARMMMMAIGQDTQNIQVRREDLPALRISCRTLPDGRHVVSLVEHVLNIIEPVRTDYERTKYDGALPVVVAREGFEVPGQLSEALERLEEGFALYDEEDRFILCNRKFCELLFVDPEARPRPGESMDDIVLRAGMTNASRGKPEGMSIEEYAAHATAGFKSLAKKVRYPLDDGKIMEVSGYRTANGGSLYTLLDITEREAAAEEAERQRALAHQSEKLSALGELLAGVAHELNNPLSIVVGYAQILEGEIEDEKAARRVAKIRTAAERSARIVKTFLAMARQRPAKMETAEVAELIDVAADVAAYGFRASGGEMAIEVPAALPAVEVDQDQMIQVLSNLMVNAEQAMKGMGEASRLAVTARARGDRVEIAVSDNGAGMDAETQARIFEPFFTTKDVGQGTGFGLAFCHRIVTAHGGTLTVRSAPGVGSTFTVSLPAIAKVAKGARNDDSGQASAGLSLLVVDDESDVADLMAELLAARGHRPSVAYSPVDALRMVADTDFDAVISDMKMPGLSGDRLMERLVAQRPSLERRFGFVTGDSLSERVASFLGTGDHPYIEKPVVSEELDGLLDELAARMEDDR